MELVVGCVRILQFVAKWKRHSVDDGVRWWWAVTKGQP